jgi:hypothetical protein
LPNPGFGEKPDKRKPEGLRLDGIKMCSTQQKLEILNPKFETNPKLKVSKS